MSFKDNFRSIIPEIKDILKCPESEQWSVKGFIDCYKNIYSISIDTKVVSKIIELMIFPKLFEFANNNNLTIELPEHQNHYPDLTFIDSEGNKYAVDIKSTYRKNLIEVNGMTLGAFTGYFRDRRSTKNTSYAYNEYDEHYVFGVIYSRADNEVLDEKEMYNLDNFDQITSVVNRFDFFFQEKWSIASDKPRSGNTKNIGSIKNIEKLKQGVGLFKERFNGSGKDRFDSYWTNYQTKDMALRSERSDPPYNNIDTFLKWKDSL